MMFWSDTIPNKVNSEETGSIVAAKKLIKKRVKYPISISNSKKTMWVY